MSERRELYRSPNGDAWYCAWLGRWSPCRHLPVILKRNPSG